MERPAGFRIGTLAGTTIHIELSFLILVAIFVFFSLEGGSPIEVALLWIPILLVSVLVHELGHAGMLGFLGFGPSHIALAGFGGYTYNPRRSRPWQDLLISLAGPIMSFALAAAAWFVGARLGLAARDPMLNYFLPLLAWANLVWGILNLVPIYPLDGGQVLRNLLLLFTGTRPAFIISTWISIVLACLIIVGGIYTRRIFLTVIAVMLLIQNYQRWKMYREGAPLE